MQYIIHSGNPEKPLATCTDKSMAKTIARLLKSEMPSHRFIVCADRSKGIDYSTVPSWTQQEIK